MAFDHLSVYSFDVLSPLVGGALQFPKGFWEPGSFSCHKAHFGQGSTATPFLAAVNIGPSATSPISINTLGMEILTGIRNCFGADIKIGSDIKFGALDVSYNAVNSELNVLKGAAVPAWNATTPSWIQNAFRADQNSPDGNLNGLWKFNGSIIATLPPSDARAKTNVVNLKGSLDKVLSLRGVSFDWDPEVVPKKAKIQKKSIGLIAQEVEEVVPEVVITGKIENQDLKSIEYGNLSALLIEAIKEQQKQIEELKQKIAQLEGNK